MNGRHGSAAAHLAGALLAILLIGCGAGGPRPDARQLEPGLHEDFVPGGLERTFVAYVPDGVEARPAVVLALHGGSGGNATRIRMFIGRELEALADEGRFLVVYPNGYGGSWNDCRADAVYPAKSLAVDDVGFLRRLIAHLEREYGADPERVFLLGYSNGGHLAYRVALEAPDAVRGIAAFAASLPSAATSECEESGAALPVLIVAGTADPISPFDGGEVVLPDGTPLGTVRSAVETLVYFGELAGHRDDPDRVPQPTGDSGPVRVESAGWSGPDGPPVRLYVVRGGGHTIPSADAPFPDFLGPTERGFEAVEAAIRFFGLL